MKVKLDNVVNSLYMVNNTTEYYYNPIKGEFFSSNIGDYENLSEDDLEDLFENNIILPTYYEINEHKMMSDFISSIKKDNQKEELYNLIIGKIAFRKFKDAFIKFNIINDWYKYMNEEYRKVAIMWCNKNRIEFK